MVAAIVMPLLGTDPINQAYHSIFAITGRIWLLMVAHAAFDLAAVAIIYWTMESVVAHLVFK